MKTFCFWIFFVWIITPSAPLPPETYITLFTFLPVLWHFMISTYVLVWVCFHPSCWYSKGLFNLETIPLFWNTVLNYLIDLIIYFHFFCFLFLEVQFGWWISWSGSLKYYIFFSNFPSGSLPICLTSREFFSTLFSNASIEFFSFCCHVIKF